MRGVIEKRLQRHLSHAVINPFVIASSGITIYTIMWMHVDNCKNQAPKNTVCTLQRDIGPE